MCPLTRLVFNHCSKKISKMKSTIVLYPASGIGHIVSMVEFGRLLLLHHSHSFYITILLTTGFVNIPSLDSYIHRISQSYPCISFRRFPFLAVEPAASPRSFVATCFEFIRLNDANVASFLKDISQSSNVQALVIDLFCTSVLNIGSSLGIPVYYFFTSGAAVLSASTYFPKIHKQITKSFKDLSMDLHFPANPPLKAFHIAEPLLDRDDPAYWDFLNCCSHIPKSSGIIVNTFQELEPIAVKVISEGACFPDPEQAPPVYYIGPLIAEPKDGNEEETEDRGRLQNCLRWLEVQPSRSVVYLCFGSCGAMSKEQLKEIAYGLEKSEQRFLWVVKRPPIDERTKLTSDTTGEFDLDSVLPSGFIERTRDNGIVVRSWAPQVEVLARESVGGFVTHCGWNSVLEAVVAGVPMIAWPLHAEQHMNRNLLVEDMKMAKGLEHREEDGFVKGDELEKKVRELMEPEKGIETRQRSLKMRDLAESARGPLGSSTGSLNKLVERWNNNYIET